MAPNIPGQQAIRTYDMRKVPQTPTEIYQWLTRMMWTWNVDTYASSNSNLEQRAQAFKQHNMADTLYKASVAVLKNYVGVSMEDRSMVRSMVRTYFAKMGIGFGHGRVLPRGDRKKLCTSVSITECVACMDEQAVVVHSQKHEVSNLLATYSTLTLDNSHTVIYPRALLTPPFIRDYNMLAAGPYVAAASRELSDTLATHPDLVDVTESFCGRESAIARDKRFGNRMLIRTLLMRLDMEDVSYTYGDMAADDLFQEIVSKLKDGDYSVLEDIEPASLTEHQRNAVQAAIEYFGKNDHDTKAAADMLMQKKPTDLAELVMDDLDDWAREQQRLREQMQRVRNTDWGKRYV